MYVHGDKIIIDDLELYVLYPNNKNIDTNENNNSLVLKLKYYDTQILFTGDLEAEEEKNITQDVQANILKVGHHGSKTSTSEEFLTRVKPQISLIGVGKNNGYGHPNSNVIERLKSIGTQIYRTDESGEIKLKIYKNGKIKVKELIATKNSCN